MMKGLKVLFAAISLLMIVVTIRTSMQESLFDVWDGLASQPWVVATLIDFYNNILIIWMWVVYKERTWTARFLWLVAFVAGGSITTAAYVCWQFMKLKPGEGVETVLLRSAAKV